MSGIQRVAIVSGAAGGIGRAMVRGLPAAGIRVAGVDRDRDPLKALAASAREQGKATERFTVQTDLISDSGAPMMSVTGLSGATALAFKGCRSSDQPFSSSRGEQLESTFT